MTHTQNLNNALGLIHPYFLFAMTRQNKHDNTTNAHEQLVLLRCT
jgi:hypothetical protein